MKPAGRGRENETNSTHCFQRTAVARIHETSEEGRRITGVKGAMIGGEGTGMSIHQANAI
jgi:hypothetical protein